MTPKTLWIYSDGEWRGMLPYHEPEPRQKPGRKLGSRLGYKLKHRTEEKKRICTRCHQPRSVKDFRYANSTICIPCLKEYMGKR